MQGRKRGANLNVQKYEQKQNYQISTRRILSGKLFNIQSYKLYSKSLLTKHMIHNIYKMQNISKGHICERGSERQKSEHRKVRTSKVSLI